MLRTTVGQLLINEALPPELRDYTRKLDAKGLTAFMQELAEKHPDKYREIEKELTDVGRDVAYSTGGQTFGLRHLAPTPAVVEMRAQVRQQVRKILDDPKLNESAKDAQIVKLLGDVDTRMMAAVLEEADAGDNPLAAQVRSGSRGSPIQLKGMIGSPVLYADDKGDPIPYPIMGSYADGLSPAEHWAAAYGARAGVIAMKFATQDAGYLAKQLTQLSHRLLVTAVDGDEPKGIRGLPVDTDTDDNDGALLAAPIGGYKRNTIITPKVRKDLADRGFDQILVRSPTVGGPPQGGVYARDVGVRERGGLSPLGDMVGLAASQAVSEKLTQSQLRARAVGGGEASASGFKYLDQLLQVPKHFPGGATHAETDGRVTKIEDAPTGGWFVRVDNTKHYVPPEFEVSVKPGDVVEAGDMLSNGIPNPAQVVKYKGIGEGKRYFVEQFTKGYRDSGMKVNRRNVELVARGLIDHVEMNDWYDDRIPGDVVQYSALEHSWEPRPGTQRLPVSSAAGKYLEQPVLHYSIGTKIRPSVIKQLNKFGVKDVEAHDEPAPFVPQMIRAADISSYDPDAITRFIGSNQKRNLLEAVHYGGSSDTKNTSYVPARIEGVGFGKTWPQSILRPPKA